MRKKLLAGLLLVGMVMGVLAGCGTDSGKGAASNSASASKAEGQTTQDDRVVNIGTMNLVNGDLIAQYEKYYENE